MYRIDGHMVPIHECKKVEMEYQNSQRDPSRLGFGPECTHQPDYIYIQATYLFSSFLPSFWIFGSPSLFFSFYETSFILDSAKVHLFIRTMSPILCITRQSSSPILSHSSVFVHHALHPHCSLTPSSRQIQKGMFIVIFTRPIINLSDHIIFPVRLSPPIQKSAMNCLTLTLRESRWKLKCGFGLHQKLQDTWSNNLFSNSLSHVSLSSVLSCAYIALLRKAEEGQQWSTNYYVRYVTILLSITSTCPSVCSSSCRKNITRALMTFEKLSVEGNFPDYSNLASDPCQDRCRRLDTDVSNNQYLG